MKPGSGKNKSGKGAKDKTPKAAAPKKSAQVPPPVETFDKAAALRIAKTRNKIAAALDDPDMRTQLVRAIRSMMNEER